VESVPTSVLAAAMDGRVRWMVNASAWSPSEADFETAISHLQAEERARVRRYHFERDRKRALIGRLLLRRLCASVLRSPLDVVRLSRTPQGKPYLVRGWCGRCCVSVSVTMCTSVFRCACMCVRACIGARPSTCVYICQLSLCEHIHVWGVPSVRSRPWYDLCLCGATR
jgi:4'-phosphopantetheinyl transferase, N-terminal